MGTDRIIRKLEQVLESCQGRADYAEIAKHVNRARTACYVKALRSKLDDPNLDAETIAIVTEALMQAGVEA